MRVKRLNFNARAATLCRLHRNACSDLCISTIRTVHRIFGFDNTRAAAAKATVIFKCTRRKSQL